MPPFLFQAVSCKMSQWGAWSPCSTNCGTGSQKTIRNVQVHPLHGGSPCPSDTTMERGCHEMNCTGR